MSKAKLPLKFSVFKCVAEADGLITAADIMKILQAEYEGERQFTKKRIELYLTALNCVSMIHEKDFDFDENRELMIYYELSELGKQRVKYLPKTLK